MLFALVLGLLVGGAAAILIGQWRADAFGAREERLRLLTPAGPVIRTRHRRRAA
jgi:hypothetical protein